MKKIALAAMILMFAGASVAEAGYRSSFRTSTYKSSSWSKPSYRSSPTVKIIRQPTTIINQTVVQRSGGGMFDSMIGTIGGMAIYNWLFGDDNKEAEQK
ncbi:hypothetical protein [Rhizobium phage RHph_X3_9]|nr:hypothetical protein [Rhizobium phage RHph_X3_9]